MPLPVERRRRRAPPSDPSPSPPGRRARFDGPFGELRSILGDDFVDNHGIVLLLFETPSGFAIFSFCGMELYKPDAIQSMWVNFTQYRRARDVCWLKEFQTFDDKFSAINVDTGVNQQLREMIMKWRRPRQTLVVGKPEYKSIIESSLGIPCLHDEVVMELMWGMQRLMHKFLPREKLELPNEDCVPMSQGLQMLLSRYGFHVSPEMVNEQIVLAASALFKYDAAMKEEYPALRAIGPYLNRVSGIDCQNWGPLKLATAFKIICTHDIGGSNEANHTCYVNVCSQLPVAHFMNTCHQCNCLSILLQMFSKDVQLKLLKDADGYKDLINKAACMSSYRAVVSAHQGWAKNKTILSSLAKKDEEVHESA